MSKEAIMFCLDVGSTMGPHLGEAIEGMKLLIESKILQTKQNEIGVVLFGSNETNNALFASGREGYENVSVFSNLERPPVALSSRLDRIEIGQGRADLIDGLVVSVDMMFKKVREFYFYSFLKKFQ
jgi:ATP-dependent DNA helicase 2 subunit 2